MTGIIFGSTMGNTEKAAELLSAKLGGDVELVNVADMNDDTLEKYEKIFLGTSTWGVGDLQDDWETKIDVLKKSNLTGKVVGLFGCGDQQMYPDSYVDAIGILYETVKDSGCSIMGQWPTDGYDFSDSKAVVDGKFVGLALDEDNQSDLTESRIAEWVGLVK